MIAPDYAPHVELEDTAVGFMRQCGYEVFQQTYHESFPEQTVSLLRKNFSVPSLYIRSRADRIAISKNRQFEFEIKTHFNGFYGDLTLELFPLLMHISKVNFIDCLYICLVNDLEFGFWASDIPRPKFICIPDMPKNREVKTVIEKYLWMFGDTPVYSRVSGGSNDPYILFGESEIRRLPHWTEYIKEQA